jgi:predicted short-subunit dehydrogenase-like oxidoreductase (DUF2520 family)
MKKNHEIKIAIIGAGRLGTTLAYKIAAKRQKEIKIVSISSPTKKALNQAKKLLGRLSEKILFTKNNKEAAREANTIFICTPDDSIKTACREIFGKKSKIPAFAVHFSGSKPLNDLESAKKAGAGILSIHPLKAFASISGAIKTLKGTEYGITYNTPQEEKLAKKIVDFLGGHSIIVADSKKPLYHAAACVASNYLVTLIDYAVYLNEVVGITPKESLKGLVSLAEGTLKNIGESGTKKSLTGPIARGDIGTVKDHIKSLKDNINEENIEIYMLMGRRTTEIAKQNDWIDDKTYKELINIFEDRRK